MNRYNILKYGLLIVTFSYVTMCPAAEKIGKGCVDRTVITKIRSAFEREQPGQGELFAPGCSPAAAQSAVPRHAAAAASPVRLAEFCPASMLDVLSAIRLRR
jgi:hypothetical protein